MCNSFTWHSEQHLPLELLLLTDPIQLQVQGSCHLLCNTQSVHRAVYYKMLTTDLKIQSQVLQFSHEALSSGFSSSERKKVAPEEFTNPSIQTEGRGGSTQREVVV